MSIFNELWNSETGTANPPNEALVPVSISTVDEFNTFYIFVVSKNIAACGASYVLD